jgi:membrane protease YdiL (CAAX protease family)
VASGVGILIVLFTSCAIVLAISYGQNLAKILLSLNLGAIFKIAVIALNIAVWEEVVFRAWALSYFVTRYGAFKACLATSILFAAIHLDFIHILNIPFYIAIAWIALKVGSIAIGIIWHFMWNFLYFLKEDLYPSFAIASAAHTDEKLFLMLLLPSLGLCAITLIPAIRLFPGKARCSH